MKLLSRKSVSAIVVFAVMSFFCTVTVFAQNFPQVSPGSRPEAEMKSVEQELQKPEKKSEVEDYIVEEEQEVQEIDSDKEVFIERILIENNTIYSVEDLQKITKPYEGTIITLRKLNEIAAEITQMYRKEGYITSFAYVPPQKIDNEEVTIRIVEGRIGAVKVEDNKYFTKPMIKWQFRSKAGDVVKYNDMLWDLERLNKNPDRQVQAVLLPSEEKEKTDIVLKVKEQFPVHLTGTYNNKGTSTTGHSRFALNLVDNNFLGLDDTAQAFIQGGKEAFALYLIDEIPITNSGTNLGLSYSVGKVRPKKHLAEFDIMGNSKTYSIYLLQTFPKSLHIETSLMLGFDLVYSDTKVLGNRFSNDNFSVVKGSYTVKFDDPWGYNIFSNELSLGIRELFGANGRNHLSSARRGIDGSFFKSTFSFYRTQMLPWTLMANFNFKAQLADSRLAPAQQFYFGGVDSVRGYPQSEVSSDNGLFLASEVIMPAFMFGSLRMPFAKTEKIKDQLSFVGFYDFGLGSLRNPFLGDDSFQEIMSVGGGLRYQIRKHMHARVEVGFPVSQRSSDNRDYQIHFSVRTELF